ncbi:MAG: YybH family protein [Actinomycetota bacterium]
MDTTTTPLDVRTAHVRAPEDLDPAWARAFNDGDAEAVLSLYEPGATFVMPSGEAISGAGPLRQALDAFLATEPTIDLRTRKVLRAGDLALVFSDWTLSATGEDGAAVGMAGDATVVARRQADGTWLVAVDDPGWITP